MAIQVNRLKSKHGGSGRTHPAGGKSSQVIAWHSSILGDIVNREPQVVSHWMISL